MSRERQSNNPPMEKVVDDGVGENPYTWTDRLLKSKSARGVSSAALAIFSGLASGSAMAADTAIVEQGEMPSQSVLGDELAGLIEESDLSQYKTIEVGYKGEEVAKLKQRMVDLGYFKNSSSVNDTFTSSTAEYIKKFQEVNGLEVDGIADTEMQVLFFSDLAKRVDGTLVVPAEVERELETESVTTDVVDEEIRAVSQNSSDNISLPNKTEIESNIKEPFVINGKIETIYSKYLFDTDMNVEMDSELNKRKEELLKLGEHKERLDLCTHLLWHIDFDRIYFATGMEFTEPEKTMVSKYLSREQVVNFYLTGQGMDVIYHKNEKGEKTNKAALAYVGGSDLNFGVEAVQQAIDEMEEDAPGYLKTLNSNHVYGFFQMKAGSKTPALAAYREAVVYYNYGKQDKKRLPDVVDSIKKILNFEQFGSQWDYLLSGYAQELGTIVKGELGRMCCQNLYEKTNKKIYKDYASYYKNSVDTYLKNSQFDPVLVDYVIEKVLNDSWFALYGY